MNASVLGCDWGTSNFRLGWYDRAERRLLGTIETRDGIGVLHRQWKSGAAETAGISLRNFLTRYLARQIGQLSADISLPAEGIPVLISGMASSAIGLAELPYADMPFPLDGSRAVIKRIPPETGFPHALFVISGIRSAADVMRGEETQLAGIAELLRVQQGIALDGMVICPGTHSKHVLVRDGAITAFSTFMTGELFSVMAEHSMLRDSIIRPPLEGHSPAAMDAFRAGVRAGAGNNLLRQLFTVRTNRLFSSLGREDNGYYLSGVIIGHEIAALEDSPATRFLICAGGALREFYQRAVEEAGLANRCDSLAPGLVEQAAFTGQRVIYDHFINQHRP